MSQSDDDAFPATNRLFSWTSDLPKPIFENRSIENIRVPMMIRCDDLSEYQSAAFSFMGVQYVKIHIGDDWYFVEKNSVGCATCGAEHHDNIVYSVKSISIPLYITEDTLASNSLYSLEICEMLDMKYVSIRIEHKEQLKKFYLLHSDMSTAYDDALSSLEETGKKPTKKKISPNLRIPNYMPSNIHNLEMFIFIYQLFDIKFLAVQGRDNKIYYIRSECLESLTADLDLIR